MQMQKLMHQIRHRKIQKLQIEHSLMRMLLELQKRHYLKEIILCYILIFSSLTYVPNVPIIITIFLPYLQNFERNLVQEIASTSFDKVKY